MLFICIVNFACICQTLLLYLFLSCAMCVAILKYVINMFCVGKHVWWICVCCYGNRVWMKRCHCEISIILSKYAFVMKIFFEFYSFSVFHFYVWKYNAQYESINQSKDYYHILLSKSIQHQELINYASKFSCLLPSSFYHF